MTLAVIPEQLRRDLAEAHRPHQAGEATPGPSELHVVWDADGEAVTLCQWRGTTREALLRVDAADVPALVDSLRAGVPTLL